MFWIHLVTSCSNTLLCLPWFLNTNFELNRLSDLLLVRVFFLFMQILCYCKFLANLPTAVDGVVASVAAVAAAVGGGGGGEEVPRPVWVCLAFLQAFLDLGDHHPAFFALVHLSLLLPSTPSSVSSSCSGTRS